MNDVKRAAPAAALAHSAWLATRYELLPIRGMQEAARALPEGAVATVTCSPRHGLERTLEATEWLATAGFRAVPHLAARLVRDRAHLERLLARLAALGVEDVFVVGGDAERPLGAYADGLALLEAMADLAPRPPRVGVPAYPEGHHRIDTAALQRDFEAKAALADYAVTQLCFEAAPLLAWRERQRRGGLRLPMYAGLPGVMERKRLLSIALRLGLGPSVRALRRQTGWMTRLLRPAAYRPDHLVARLWPLLGDAEAGFAGLHLYTFNRVAPTRAWLEALPDVAPPRHSVAESGEREASAAGEPLG